MALPHLFLGTLREHYLMLFGAAGVIGVATGFVGSWIGAYYGARRAIRAAQLERSRETEVAMQLAPVMQALDAIALEVERVSEGQRFATKMLTERQPVMLPRSEPRNITPH
ncbi:MAG: hypothetical protein V4550_04695 [Gemmatimonadota bacterium]